MKPSTWVIKLVYKEMLDWCAKLKLDSVGTPIIIAKKYGFTIFWGSFYSKYGIFTK